jgi:hypothetical protein
MLTDITIEKTKVTPAVVMRVNDGFVEIAGESYPENSVEFYQPLFDWLEAFADLPNKPMLTLRFRLSYFNTSSSKCIMDLLDIAQSYYNRSGGAATIEWYYHEDDEDMLESGREFAEDMDLPIQLVAFR